MTALQFIHLNGYGRTPGRGRESHETIEGVTAEAARMKGNAPHIPCPNEPTIIYGVGRIQVGQEAIRLSFQAKNCLGHRLKSDGVVLVAGVATYPIPIADMGAHVSQGKFSGGRTKTACEGREAARQHALAIVSDLARDTRTDTQFRMANGGQERSRRNAILYSDCLRSNPATLSPGLQE
jgi:hypothetical protein